MDRPRTCLFFFNFINRQDIYWKLVVQKYLYVNKNFNNGCKNYNQLTIGYIDQFI